MPARMGIRIGSLSAARALRRAPTQSMTTAATSAAPPVMPVATATVPAIRSVAMRFPYDSHVDGEASLRGNPDEVSAALKSEVQARLDVAGLEILEARLSHLAYAPEIAQSMLRRQQAEAIVAARGRIVEGAVGMVEMALRRLEDTGVVHLDEERKAAMVNNLLVALVADREAQPVINTGSLY